MGAAGTRQQILEAADRLFYEQGFEATSFADIAAAVRLSRGNFYYHFKTKDEILDAVIALRLTNTGRMLEAWEAGTDNPVERIRSFIHILITNRAKIMLYGCPVGTLCNELSKLDHAAKEDATRLFALFRDWLARQFTALGRDADAEALAMHVLMRSQGVATLATAFRDDAFVQREVEDMCVWLEAQRPGASHLDPVSPLNLKKEPSGMFVVTLRFSANRAEAAKHMDGHNAWIRRGFGDGVFLLTGSLPGGAGGAVLAHNISRDDLDARLRDDPFVAEKVVDADILEITPGRVDDRLAFLQA